MGNGIWQMGNGTWDMEIGHVRWQAQPGKRARLTLAVDAGMALLTGMATWFTGAAPVLFT
jgi:hypothetical protein